MARPTLTRDGALFGARWLALLLVASAPLLMAPADAPDHTIRSVLRFMRVPSPAAATSRATAQLQLTQLGGREVNLSLELWLERPSGFLMEQAVLQPRLHPRDNPTKVIVLTEHALLDKGTLYASGSVRLSHTEARRLLDQLDAFELVVTSVNATQGELRGRLERAER